MALTLDGTAGITFPSGSGTQAAQSKVLQVVSVPYSTSTSTTSTSFVNTGLSASITPLFSTSKVFIICSFMGYDAGGAGVNWYATIQRGSTNLGSATVGMATIYNSAGGVQGGYAISYLDAPATTSSTTYSFAYAKSGGTAYLNFNGETSSITLMEIAA